MHDSNKWQLILASASPRRRELLAHTGATFSVKVAAIEEHSPESDPRLFALDIARQKGVAVRNTLEGERLAVVSADTVVALGQKIYGKPRDRSEAQAFLRELAGGTHLVHTALVISLRHEGRWREISHVETTQVDFGPMDEHWLARYLASGDSLDKAGGYGIQGQALAMVTGIRGCYANVVGFPLARFSALMAAELSGEGTWQSLF